MSLFDDIQAFVQANVYGITQQLYQGYTGTTTTGNDPTVLNAAVAQSINTRLTVLEGSGVLTQYTSSATWTKPTVSPSTGAAYQPDDLFTIVCINGGQGGSRSSQYAGGAPGGESGGYVSQQVKYSALPASVAMTIGAGTTGAASNNTYPALGGVTSFGSLVVGVAGLGSIAKADGSYSTAVPPGNGGVGGMASGAFPGGPTNADPGVSSAFAAGGQAGLGAAGGNGAAAPSGFPTGGGGGGGGGVASSSSTFVGGNGGFPGGAGGGGAYYGSSGTPSNGGNGAAGCIFVIAPY